MWTSSFIWIVHFTSLTLGLHNTKVLQNRRSSSVARPCPTGCTSCSALNGCLSCKPRFFFHLELDGMRERGTCVSTCPRGHYGNRSPHINTCKKCKEDCAFCFSENFCTHCQSEHFLFRGKCGSECPSGLTANAALRECTECPAGCEVCVRRSACVRCRAGLYLLRGSCHHACPNGTDPDSRLMRCSPHVNCEVGEWTAWSPCIRRASAQTYRKGEETRSRQVLRSLSTYGDLCPRASESRKCALRDTVPLRNKFLKSQRH